MFTPEELAAMAAADAEIEASFQWTNAELNLSRELDKIANMEAMTQEKRKRAESKRAYREANKEKLAEYQRAYYKANKEKAAEYQRAYYEANKEKLAESQKAIVKARKARGMRQNDLAVLLGVSRATVAMWETGAAPAPWDRLSKVFPELGAKEAHNLLLKECGVTGKIIAKRLNRDQ